MCQATARVGSRGVSPPGQKQREVGLRLKNARPAGIGLDSATVTIVQVEGVDFINDRMTNLTASRDANFLAGVATQHGTVMDQSHAEARACRGQAGTASCHAAAHDDTIKALAPRGSG